MSKERATAAPSGQAHSGADPLELDKFAALADRFWDPAGPMRPLHLMNPIRLEYILDRTIEAFKLERAQPHPLQDLQCVDVGCGAGLLCEPLRQLGANVTGVDAEPQMVRVAQAHAAAASFDIGFLTGTADDLAAAGRSFDLVVALEVVEHVPDPYAFMSGLAELARPGGIVIVSTLARTLKSLAFAIGAAEYLLHWLPRGTHRWSRF